MIKYFNSLRFRIILIILLAVLPALILVSYHYLWERRRETARTQQEVMRLAQQAAMNQQHLIHETHQLLMALAQLPALRQGQGAPCSTLFARLMEKHPCFAYIRAAEANGRVFASSIPLNGRIISITDRPFFQQVMRTRDFTLGPMEIRKATGRATFHAAYPVLDEHGRVEAVVFAALGLDWLRELAGQAQLPPGFSIGVIDGRGTIMGRYPDPERWVGQPGNEIHRIILRQGRGMASAHGIDGTLRLYAFTPLGDMPQTGFVYVGIPEQLVYASANRAFAQNLITLAAVSLLALLAAWGFGYLFLVRRVDDLVTTSRQLAAGHLEVRTGPAAGPAELDHLAQSLDQMAESLEQREGQRLQAKQALVEANRWLEAIIQASPAAILTINPKARVQMWNPAAERLFGWRAEEVLGMMPPFIPDDKLAEFHSLFGQVLQGEMLSDLELTRQKKDGAPVEVSLSTAPLRDPEANITGIMAIFMDITARKQAEADLRESQERFESFMQHLPGLAVMRDREQRYLYVNEAWKNLYPPHRDDWLGKSLEEVCHPAVAAKLTELDRQVLATGEPLQLVLPLEYPDQYPDRRFHWLAHFFPLKDEDGTPTMVGAIAIDISERIAAIEQAQRHLRSLNLLVAGAEKLARTRTPDQMAREVCQAVVEAFGARLVCLGWADPDGRVRPLAAAGEKVDFLKDLDLRWDDSPEGRGPSGRAIREGQAAIIADVAAEPDCAPWGAAAQAQGLQSLGAFPLTVGERAVGVLNIYCGQSDFFSPEKAELLQTFARIAAASLENTRLSAETEQRLQRLAILRKIDMAISGSLDLRIIFEVLLDQITAQLGLDAAAILFLNPHSHMLEYAAGRGFRGKGITQSRVTLGEGVTAGKAALERRLLHLPDLSQAGDKFRRSQLLAEEEFVTYLAAPLISKGQIKGVLELFHRAPLAVDEEWLDFLESLAGQAAIAIDNARLFDDLETANLELALAYNATLEGWARALELREYETAGHSQRVTDMTLRLARKMGITDKELVQVQRGALLHDIGKIGVPDSILLKPGSLTEEEWDIMQQHTEYAFRMLSPIPYLKGALDIPCCHHERWDGTGYPWALKGKAIPLAARIFAVVDVFDALTSDRPYRPAWPREKALEHIREQAGKHFDPEVAAAFLEEFDGTEE